MERGPISGVERALDEKLGPFDEVVAYLDRNNRALKYVCK